MDLRHTGLSTIHSLALSIAVLGLAACAASTAEPTAQASIAREPGLQRLTMDDLYGSKKSDFVGKPVSGLIWLDDAHYLWSKVDTEKKKTDYLIVEAATGKTEPFADLTQIRAAIQSIPGATEKDVDKLAKPDSGSWSTDRRAQLLTFQKDLWVARFDSDAIVRVTNTPELEEIEASFSPDGKHVAFVRDNDLYVGNAVAGGERRLTTDGSETVLNGTLDWLYQEEVYGRGNFHGYWWSPDSGHLAFLRLDEAKVPIYTIVDDVAEPIRVEQGPYPRAGEPNPDVKLGLVEITAGAPAFVDLSAYETSEPLIVEVSWSPANRVAYQVQDREQTWLDLCIADADGRNIEKLVHETTQAWVEPHGPPKFLADGTFLWFSERTGYKHLYRYRGAALVNAVTHGEWEARSLHGVDEKNGWVYFSGTAASPIGSDPYRAKLDGSGWTRLSTTEGTHSANFSTGFSYFIDSWSDLWTPKQVRLHTSAGELVRALDVNPVPAIERFELPRPELLQVKTRDGFAMEAMMIKPLDFDPTRKYPVMMFLYAGPHAPTVKNAWAGTDGMFQRYLASRDVIVWCCDNRSASGKGAVSAWTAYKQLGIGECADIEDGIAWLAEQPWVDAERVGVTGWSYGGFMSSYLLTHSKRFALGVAGGSVTDWHDYDSIYTERLMRTPQNNKEGYERTSVVKAAKDLHGALVLAHGAIDDNVHPANTTRLAYALQKAGKSFELMLYPKSRHGVNDASQARHWKETTLAAIEKYLLAPRP